jgi:hypothetical protein
MTREDLVALKAMRAEIASLEVDVVQLDLAAKRALVADPDAAELVALYAEDVRGRVAAARSTVAAHLGALKHIARKGGGR